VEDATIRQVTAKPKKNVRRKILYIFLRY